MKLGHGRVFGFLLAVVGMAACMQATGCSNTWNDRWRRMMPPTYAAGGTVTYRGKPLDGATVIFHPRDGVSPPRRAATGLTDASGHFTLTTVKPGDGAVAGAFLVSVQKTTAEIPGAVSVPPDEFGAFPLGADPTTATSLIPEMYALPETSGLTAEVRPHGRNQFTFALEEHPGGLHVHPRTTGSVSHRHRQ